MRNLADGNLFSGLSISKSGKCNTLTALWINFLHAGSLQIIYYLLWQINANVAQMCLAMIIPTIRHVNSVDLHQFNLKNIWPEFEIRSNECKMTKYCYFSWVTNSVDLKQMPS